jgi:hypothetical protein
MRGYRAKQSQSWEEWGIWEKETAACGTDSPGSGMCETNPICTCGEEPRSGVKCAKQTQFAARRAGKTLVKAKSPGDAARHQGNHAKQTQFLASPSTHHSSPMPIVQNKANLPGRPGMGAGGRAGRTRHELCKTKPIWLFGRGPGGRNTLNEPNFRGRFRFEVSSDRAKQSQFGDRTRRGPARCQGGQRGQLYKQTQFADRGFRQARAGAVAGGAVAWARRGKQSQFPSLGPA